MYKTLQLIASKFAVASASTKPPPVDTYTAGSLAPSTVALNAPGSQLSPTSELTDSGALTPPSVSAATSGTARPQTPTFSRARAPEPSASSTGGAQGPSADASAASASASMPSDANLQETGGYDEPFAPDTGTDFEQSAYSDVLDRGLADIRTPVMPHAKRHAHPEAPRKQPAESAAKHKHQHSKTKRARRHSLTKSKVSAVSLPKSPEATTPAPARCTPPAEQVPSRSTQRRKATERADASRRATSEERTPPDWSDEGETERSRPSSPVHQASPVAVVGGRELLFDSSSESSELSDVNPTASRSRPRRSHAASHTRERRQPTRGQSPRPEDSATSTAEPEGVAAKEDEEELPMTVTVPGRRQEIAKRTCRKVQIPLVYKARQLVGRVNAI